MMSDELKKKLRAAIAKAQEKGYEVKGVGGGYYTISPDKKRSQVMGISTFAKWVESL